MAHMTQGAGAVFIKLWPSCVSCTLEGWNWKADYIRDDSLAVGLLLGPANARQSRESEGPKTLLLKRVLPHTLEEELLNRETRKNVNRQALWAFPTPPIHIRPYPFCPMLFLHNGQPCLSSEVSIEGPRGLLNMWMPTKN
ncbi:uncharacterized protein LOC134761379 isoform X2 [Pongo abelii]|uniref:uncharacterized protein LOC134761379 isoform X2 n=1 Tax=Pongo abelii TaxID=9601 RepID=UPI003005600D